MPVALGLEKVTEEFPEYLGLENVVTDEMAEVAVVMDKRVPIVAAEVTKKCGKPLARTEELLEELALRGVIEYNWENEDHHKQYVLPMFVPGSAEYMNMNLDTVTAHPEVATMFERMSRLPLEKITPMVPPGGAGIGMHVVPVEKAIPSEQKSVDLEHLSHWLDKYDGKCAVGACSSRRSRRVRGEGCGHLEEDMCIAVGDMATYSIETNKARPATREEVMEILQRAEDNGFVHQITNIDGKDKILGICNCCVCSCYALRTSQLFNTPNMSASAYRAHVDPEKCVACGQCAEVCPAGAAKLGQKLYTKDGPIVYPKQVLPDETKWGPEMWNENYRDDNPSANCYDTGTAPCKSNCPAHIAVQGYIRMAAEGRYMDALKLIKKENPFPTVCGHICNRRCEQACTRGSVDRAVAIDEIKKFIAEQELHADKRYVPKMLNQRNIPFTEKIAVIGGGNVSIDVARAALRLGAEKVYLVYRRGESELKADRDEIEDALAEGMELKLLRAPSEIVGKNGKVSAIRLEIMELGETDASGRRAPVGTGEYETWNVNTVIGAIGQRVDWGALLDGENVELRKNGTAVCDGLTLQIAQPDIFVGGDVTTGPKFAIDAIAAGKEAAISLHRYVHEGQSLTIGRNRRSYPELDKRNVALPTECFDAPARQVPAALSGAQARKTFRDPRCTFTEEQVKMEASRCLGCGVSVVDTNRCIGCGVCTTKCEFDAIHLRRDHPEATKMIRSEDKMKAILPYMIKRAAKIKV
ncbi:MAG TPA: FAD-dependent oxidoreductase [Clostridiales bacterium]|nr:FAD-dependent oxidoreductase [Clostridiales bacterium]